MRVAIIGALSSTSPRLPFLMALAEKPSLAGHEKLAEQVAISLEKKIIELGCPVGLPLGSEAELAQSYGVSRWAMREAFAITERDGLTEMRRGRNGGLLVAAPADQVVAAALCNFLLFTRVDVRELLEVRKVVDRMVYVLATRQMDDSHVVETVSLLRKRLKNTEDAIAIYDQILKFSRNKFVGIWGTALSKLSLCLMALHELRGLEPGESSPLMPALIQIRRRQLECVLAADPYGVIEASAAAADAWAEMFASPAPRRVHSMEAQARRAEIVAQQISATLHPGKTPKLADLVATRIAVHIIRNRLEPGEPIAPEPEMMALFDVGRHVLREATRVLERHGFVQIEMGRRGGLRVGHPDASSVVGRAAGYLRLLDVSPRDVEPLAAEMLILAAELVAGKSQDLKKRTISEVEACIQASANLSPTEVNHWLIKLGAALSIAAANPILSTLFALSEEIGRRKRTTSTADLKAVVETAQRLGAALGDGDVPFARRAMAQLVAHAKMIEP